jgi:hypothetical protein
MKIKIDKDGVVHIQRGKTFKVQYCIYDKVRKCRDKCVGFGEPDYNYPNYANITFCKFGYTVAREDFTDQRK